MTIIKSKKVKEIIDNIKQEQQELNNLERLEDWEERFIEQSELLNQVEKDLEDKVDEVEFLKDYEKIIRESNLDVLSKYGEEIRVLEERLKGDESQQISLLKEQHEKEIRELKRSKRIIDENYTNLNRRNLKDIDRLKELEKDLEEKELLVEYLEGEIEKIKESSETHLDFIAACEKFNKEKDKLLRDKWAGAKKKAHDRKIQLKQLELRFQSLENQFYLVNKELPPLPKKQNKFKLFKNKMRMKFQQLLEKRKVNKQELVARIEITVNK